MAETSVLITTEGTYPHYGGGVSVWCDQLLNHLPDVDFRVLSIIHTPGQPVEFPAPPNLLSLHTAPLWGTPRPGLFTADAARSFQRRMLTSSSIIRTRFRPVFEEILRGVCDPEASPADFGEALAGLAGYSRTYDYAASMSSREAWDAHLAACRRYGFAMSLGDATSTLRWLQRYLAVVTAEVPSTDIVHATMAGLGGLPGVVAKVSRGTPYILSEHGLHLREMYAALADGSFTEACRTYLVRFHSAVVRLNYHFADQITSLGPFNRRWQVQIGADPEKITMIPNGVSPERFRPRAAAEKRSRPTVLTMARIFKLKGIKPLMRAAAIVRDRVPNVLFRVLGEVADREYFASCERIIAENGLESNVEFGVTKENYKAYCEADVYCLPSLSEGAPYAVIEAMMSGCPVVATEVGNVKQIVGSTGLLVRPNDPGELASALLEVVDGHGAADFRSYLAEAALRRAREHFTLERCTGAFRQLYQEVRLAETVASISESCR